MRLFHLIISAILLPSPALAAPPPANGATPPAPPAQPASGLAAGSADYGLAPAERPLVLTAPDGLRERLDAIVKQLDGSKPIAQCDATPKSAKGAAEAVGHTISMMNPVYQVIEYGGYYIMSDVLDAPPPKVGQSFGRGYAVPVGGRAVLAYRLDDVLGAHGERPASRPSNQPATAPATQAGQPIVPSFQIQRQGARRNAGVAADEMTCIAKPAGLVIRVAWRWGIGAGDVAVTQGRWPERVVVFFAGFRSLEGFDAVAGGVTLQASLRRGEHKSVWRYDAQGQVAQDAAPAAYTLTVEQKGEADGAGIEVVLPPGFHPNDADALRLSWIDAYRQ